jgi:predicted metal-dependent enzyme (double-stranded beta helix superfamily)
MPQWTWPDSLDALIAAPEFHRLLLENDRVRVLDVRIAPGQTVPVHTHKWPSIVCLQSASDFIRRDGEGKIILDSRAAGVPQDSPVVQWLPPLPPHSVENVGTSEIHLFTVELKEPHAG